MVLLKRASVLSADERIRFPKPQGEEEIAAVGGNLSPGMLLSAYEQGLFPWYNPGDPVIWWDPAERMILPIGNIHTSRRMRRLRRNASFRITFDAGFREVIRYCAEVPRRNQEGTWIDEGMIEAYIRLHEEGYAHSVEAWEGEQLAGGLYGVSLGRAFFGESMFSLIPNCSKLCLFALHDRLEERSFSFIDCQNYSAHLVTLGAFPVSRGEFKDMLNKALQTPSLRGSWNHLSVR